MEEDMWLIGTSSAGLRIGRASMLRAGAAPLGIGWCLGNCFDSGS